MSKPTIKQDDAMVCIRRGCEVIYADSLECPLCGMIGVHYRSVEQLALESTPTPLLIDQPAKTRMIQ